MNQIEILYEDDEIFVIDKPAGLAVQGGQGVTHSLDVDFSVQTGQKVYLVHRLDKETRGLMVVAKNAAAAGKWTKLIASKAVRKEYLALCAGCMKEKSGVIKENVVQHGENKSAVTHYQVEKEWSIPCTVEGRADVVSNETVSPSSDSPRPEIPLTLIRLKLETGRMHQIRIHLAQSGCPIAGDDQHGNFKLNKQLRKGAGIKRLQLAAVRLTLPVGKTERVFEIPVDFPMK